MPSLSFTSLDRLIEPASSSPPNHVGPSTTDRSTPFSFYPPLYATPPQQRPPSPTAFSPSPYVLNFKRRVPVQQHQHHQQDIGGTEVIALNPTDLPLRQQCQEADGANREGNDVVLREQIRHTKSVDENGVPKRAHEAISEYEVFDMELEKNDVHASKHIGFSNSNQIIGSHSSINPGLESKDIFSAALGSPFPAANEDVEFFDAPDSVFSASEDDAGPASLTPKKSLEWSGRTAARLAEEVERRMKAEENAILWQKRWNALARRCASMGVSLFSAAENTLGNEEELLEMSNQELLVARLVAGAIGRAVVRAEKDEQIERLLGVKNREISRLWDKLQNLELVNREMSQRNQEVIELTQRRKRRRKRRRKLVLSGFCAAFCLGTAGLLCYKYLPWDQAKQWASTLHGLPTDQVE